MSEAQTSSDTEAALLSKFDISCNDGAMISQRITNYENGKVLRQFVVNDTGVVEYFKHFSNGTGDLVNGVGNKFENGKFVAAPTSGTSVENDLLVYPARNHRQLKLNFDVTSTKAMNFAEALSYCKAKEMRLPTVRELFDFCAAGVTEPNYGPDFRRAQYPKEGRCRENFWSVTRGSLQTGPSAWIFYKSEGSLLLAATYPSSVHARCVF